VKVQTAAESFTNAHLRLAIQQQSEPVQRRVYAHTGWKYLRDEAGDVSGLPVFLHSGGAIGSQEVTVVLDGSLARYRLPERVEDVVDAVRASLELLDIAPRVLTIPLMGAAFRAPLQSLLYADFSVCPTGRSGSQKTTVSNLFAAHYGEELVERAAANWSDTAASIEAKLFAAQDCLVVVDDFAPKAGSSHDALHAKAEVILRSIGNGASRGRMRADMTARPDRPPRALVISTGEDAPSGESIRARTVPLHFKPGVVDLERLSQAQARVGRLPHAMAAYLEWLRPRMGELPVLLRERFTFWRDHFRTEGCHLRAPAALAHLTLGLELLGHFARDTGALSATQAKRLVDDGVAVLGTLGAEQSRNVGEMDPVLRFIEVLQSLLSQGKVTLEPDLKMPLVQDKPSPGVPVGWLAGNEVYLLKEAVFGAVVSALRAMGENFPLAQMTLWRRLRDMGKLRAGDRDGHLTQRKRVGRSGRTEVLVMPLDVLFPDDKPDGGGDGGGTPPPTDGPDDEPPTSDHLDLSVEDGPAWESHLTSRPSADVEGLVSSGLTAGEAHPGRRALPVSADASGPPVDSNRPRPGPNRTSSERNRTSPGEEEEREVLETTTPLSSTTVPVVRLVRFAGGEDSPTGVDSEQTAATGRGDAKKYSSSSSLSPGTNGPSGPLEAKPWISHGNLVGHVPGANRPLDQVGADRARASTVSVAGPAVVALGLHTAGSGGRMELKYVLPDGKTGLLDASSAATLSKATVLAHDAKPVLARLASRFDVRPRAVRCTATATRLLAGDGKAAPTQEQAVLAHVPPGDPRPSIFRLDEVLDTKLKAAELTRVADLEYALLPVLVELEATGVGMDGASWQALVTARQLEADALRLRLMAALGIKNPDHDAEVLAALRARGLPVERTARAVLAHYAGQPFVADFLRYRQLMAFVRDAGKHVLEALAKSPDGRVRASFDALASPTGRMGCSTPNLLGLPKEADVRCCIVPARGSRLVVADYRAIDLRVLADVTGDEALRAVFRSGGDPHRQTAALLLGKGQPDVTEEERRRAKPVNFGFAFGMGEQRFIEYARADYGVESAPAEARDFKASYLAAYPGVADWQVRVRRGQAREVRSASGRRRCFPPGPDGYTQRLSTEVQGPAADGLKRAMVLLYSRLPAMGARMVLPVHDELLVEAPEETVVEVKSMVVAAMKEGMEEFVTSVPIEVASSVRATWTEEI
jgi:DNA polymerase-1